MAHFNLLVVGVLAIIAVAGTNNLGPEILNCCKMVTTLADCIQIMESCIKHNALHLPTGRCCDRFPGSNSHQQHRSLENKHLGHRFMIHEPFVKMDKTDRWRNFLVRKRVVGQSRLDQNAFRKQIQEINGNNTAITLHNVTTSALTTIPTTPLTTTTTTSTTTMTPSHVTSPPTMPPPLPQATIAEKAIITSFKFFKDSPWDVFLTKHYNGNTRGFGIEFESSKSGNWKQV